MLLSHVDLRPQSCTSNHLHAKVNQERKGEKKIELKKSQCFNLLLVYKTLTVNKLHGEQKNIDYFGPILCFVRYFCVCMNVSFYICCFFFNFIFNGTQSSRVWGKSTVGVLPVVKYCNLYVYPLGGSKA